jgi:hypothetical protein
VDIDEIMSEARLEGEEDVWTMADGAVTVKVTADDLGEEWVLCFTDQYDAVQYAYISLEIAIDDIVEWLGAQGVPRRSVTISEE